MHFFSIAQRKIRKLLYLLKAWLRVMLGAPLLIDTPVHGNLGDHAIAIAQRQFISDKIKTGTIFELTAKDFDHYGKAFAKAVPADAQILIHGGGYLGTLWPVEEFRFRNILQLFHRQRVIVFPQTVTFNLETESGRRFFEESKTIYESHPDLTIFVREKNSYAFMREHMPSIRCILVPDIVTTMRLNVSEADRNGVLLCLRHDVEKALSEEAVLEIRTCIQEIFPDQGVEFTDTVLEHRIFPDTRENEVRTKLSQFAGAKLIVTDRLHGMIFAALVGTPCVAFSNSNGKVRLVYEWIKDLPYIQFVNSVGELPEVLKKIDLSREYQYNYKLVEEHFRPLAEVLKEK